MKPIFVHSAVDDARLSPAEFRVYGHLARCDGKSGAWPSVPNIARACQLHKDTVSAALKALVARGMIHREKRPGFTTVYRIADLSEWKGPPSGKEGIPLQTGEAEIKGDPSPEKKGDHHSETKGHPLPEMEGDESIPVRKSKEGNPVKEIQAAHAPNSLALSSSSLSLVESERAHTFTSLAAALHMSADGMAEAFTPRLYAIAEEFKMSHEGVAEALSKWFDEKSQYFRANGTNSSTAIAHFKSWLKTQKTGKSVVRRNFDCENFDWGGKRIQAPNTRGSEALPPPAAEPARQIEAPQQAPVAPPTPMAESATPPPSLPPPIRFNPFQKKGWGVITREHPELARAWGAHLREWRLDAEQECIRMGLVTRALRADMPLPSVIAALGAGRDDIITRCNAHLGSGRS